MKEVKVRPQEKKIYDAIFSHGKRKGNDFFISYKRLSEVTGIEGTMVSGLLRILISEKIIDKQNHFNETGGLKANSYKKTEFVPVAPEPTPPKKPKKRTP